MDTDGSRGSLTGKLLKVLCLEIAVIAIIVVTCFMLFKQYRTYPGTRYSLPSDSIAENAAIAFVETEEAAVQTEVSAPIRHKTLRNQAGNVKMVAVIDGTAQGTDGTTKDWTVLVDSNVKIIALMFDDDLSVESAGQEFEKSIERFLVHGETGAFAAVE